MVEIQKAHLDPATDFLVEVDLPQAHPMDSPDTLRLKASIMLESFFKDGGIVLFKQRMRLTLVAAARRTLTRVGLHREH